MLIVNDKHRPLNLILESKASDAFEKTIAENINALSVDGKYKASRPVASTAYSDVKITRNDGKTAWLEVKMNHTDNIGNPRVFYDENNGGWQSTYSTPAAKFCCDILNDSDEAKAFIQELKLWLCEQLLDAKEDDEVWNVVTKKNKDNNYKPKDLKIILPTTKGGLKQKGAVPLSVMRKFVEKHGDRYVMRYVGDITNLVTAHYTEGKAEPAYYIQAKDDLYKISSKNPFNWKVPLFKVPAGTCHIRISTRTGFYEIQSEIKIKEMSNSEYSLKPNTNKKCPF